MARYHQIEQWASAPQIERRSWGRPSFLVSSSSRRPAPSASNLATCGQLSVAGRPRPAHLEVRVRPPVGAAAVRRAISATRWSCPPRPGPIRAGTFDHWLAFVVHPPGAGRPSVRGGGLRAHRWAWGRGQRGCGRTARKDHAVGTLSFQLSSLSMIAAAPGAGTGLNYPHFRSQSSEPAEVHCPRPIPPSAERRGQRSPLEQSSTCA